MLHAANLGDSGFCVVRKGSTVFRSPQQQKQFNFPYQLAAGSDGDSVASAEARGPLVLIHHVWHA